MLRPRSFLSSSLRTNLIVLLLVVDVATGLALKPASYWSAIPTQGASDRIDQQIKQSLRQNAEDVKFIESRGHWKAGVLFALERVTGGVFICRNDVVVEPATTKIAGTES